MPTSNYKCSRIVAARKNNSASHSQNKSAQSYGSLLKPIEKQQCSCCQLKKNKWEGTGVGGKNKINKG
jgi:hypothetical protein